MLGFLNSILASLTQYQRAQKRLLIKFLCLTLSSCFALKVNSTELSANAGACASSLMQMSVDEIAQNDTLFQTPGSDVAQDKFGSREGIHSPADMTRYLAEATEFLDGLNVFQIMAFTSIYSEVYDVIVNSGAHLPPISTIEPSFPTEFYQRYFRDLGVEEAKVREMFSTIGKNLGDPKLTPESLLILTFASSKIHFISPDKSNRGGAKLSALIIKKLEEFLRKQDGNSRLPIFRDFFERNDVALALIMAYLRHDAAAYLSVPLVSYSRKAYVALVLEKLRENPNVSLEKKIELAFSLTDFALVSPMKKSIVFEVLKGKLKSVSRLDRWLTVGIPLLASELFYFFEDLESAALSKETVLLRFPDQQFAKRFELTTDRDIRFVSEAFLFVSERLNQNFAADPVVIQRTIREGLRDLNRSLQDIAKRNLLAEQKQNGELAPIAPVVIPSAPVAGKPRGPKSLGVGRRVIAEARGLQSPRDSTKAEPSISATSEQEGSSSPKFPELTTLLKEESVAQSNTPYSFKFGGSSTSTRDSKDQNEKIHFVRFQDDLLNDLQRKNFPLSRFVRSFLSGHSNGNGGISFRHLVGTRGGNYWVIKIPSTGLRVIVEQNKESKEWIWLDVVEQNRIDHYVRHHRL